MKRLFAVLLACVMILAFTGCMDDASSGSVSSDPSADSSLAGADDLRSRDGVMLIISSTIEGPIDYYNEDRLTGITYTIDWDGTITKTSNYLTSGDVDDGMAELSSEDYMTVYEFAEDAYNNDTYRGYFENDVMDGSTYGFTYYPADSSEGVQIFGGYCYSNDSLNGIIKLAESYFR